MKKLLLIFLLISVKATAQCDMAVDKIDEFNGDVVKRTSSEYLSEELIGMSMRINDWYYIMMFSTEELGCISDNSYIIILYKDKTTEELYNISPVDCGDRPVFGICPQTKDVWVKPIDKIRYCPDHCRDYIVSNNFYFVDNFKCLQ